MVMYKQNITYNKCTCISSTQFQVLFYTYNSVIYSYVLLLCMCSSCYTNLLLYGSNQDPMAQADL